MNIEKERGKRWERWFRRHVCKNSRAKKDIFKIYYSYVKKDYQMEDMSNANAAMQFIKVSDVFMVS